MANTINTPNVDNELSSSSKEQRDKLLNMNNYNSEDKYSSNHPNAQSNDTAIGRGSEGYLDTNNLDIGTAEEIAKRNELKAKNRYGRDTPYNIVEE